MAGDKCGGSGRRGEVHALIPVTDKLFPREMILLTILLSLSGCSAEFNYLPAPQNGLAREAVIRLDPETGIASTEISVLIYNVAGLPWPLSRNKRSRTLDENGQRIPISPDRTAAMRGIGTHLAAMRERGEAPDIILLQEAFIASAAEIPVLGGYPNWVAGPSARESRASLEPRRPRRRAHRSGPCPRDPGSCPRARPPSSQIRIARGRPGGPARRSRADCRRG